MKYRFLGKEKKLSLGSYPDVSLANARAKRNEAKRQLGNDIDPGLLKSTFKQSQKIAVENNFETIAREWHAKFTPKWTKVHADRILIRLENNVFPWLGKRPITDMTAPELLSAICRIEARGAIETAH